MARASRAWFPDVVARKRAKKEAKQPRVQEAFIWGSIEMPQVAAEYRYGASNCYWCGKLMTYHGGPSPDRATRDHLVPRSLGGPDCWENIVAACMACNTRRGSDIDWVPFHRRQAVVD